MNEDFDIVIIGAGLSGIGTACQMAAAHPGRTMAIVERRQGIGGTWDLFRYPGVRSDSDMYSYGYRFRPWHSPQVLGHGPTIREYIRDTAAEHGILGLIRFGLKATAADWCSRQRRWTVSALHEPSGESRRFTARFVVGCTGYYDYDAGYLPALPGLENFKGRCVHPQQWPEDLDYAGKRVVVIGSGATAVTMVPALAGVAAAVTMLQRSPSYVFSVPASDPVTALTSRVLPRRWAYAMARRRNILIQSALYKACRRWPQAMRGWLISSARKRLGPGFDMSHFTPRYMPWDERLCVVPDGDLFKVLRAGTASIVTDEIEGFVEAGIRLKSGRQLDADIVVTATGLNLQLLGGIRLSVDGAPCPLGERMTYKGVLLQDLPNLAWIFGYINASWTLKSDIAVAYLNRLLAHMDREGFDVAVPRDSEGQAQAHGVLGALNAGYVRRGDDRMPRQGRRLPWKVLMDYGRDRRMLLDEPIEDDALHFTAKAAAAAPAGALAQAA